MPSYNQTFDDIVERNIRSSNNADVVASQGSNTANSKMVGDNSSIDPKFVQSVILNRSKPQKTIPAGLNGSIIDTPPGIQPNNMGVINPKLAQSAIMDKVSPRYDGGTVINGSRGVAGTGNGFDPSVITDFGQYGEKVNGVDTLQYDMTDKMAALSPKQRQDARFAAVMGEQGGESVSVDPDSARKLAILQQDTNIAGMKARSDIESSGIGRFKQHEVVGEDLAGNPVKLPGGVLDTRTGQVRPHNQNSANNQPLSDDSAPTQSPEPPQTPQARNKAMQQYQAATKLYANNPEQLSRTRQMAIQMGLFKAE